MTKFIYTNPNCPKCHDLMKHYDDEGIAYIERSADRLKGCDDHDDIDADALALLAEQNQILPVEVNVEETNGN